MTTTKIAIPLPALPITGSAIDPGASDEDAEQDLALFKILIVDDSRFYRTVIINALAPFRLTNVIEAVDGADALEALRTCEFHMVLMDYEMPGMNGAEVVRQIRWSEDEKINAKVPIIMISDFAEKAIILAARNAGIHEFVCKPVVPSELYKRIRSTLENPREFIVSDEYRGPDRRWMEREDAPEGATG